MEKKKDRNDHSKTLHILINLFGENFVPIGRRKIVLSVKNIK